MLVFGMLEAPCHGSIEDLTDQIIPSDIDLILGPSLPVGRVGSPGPLTMMARNYEAQKLIFDTDLVHRQFYQQRRDKEVT